MLANEYVVLEGFGADWVLMVGRLIWIDGSNVDCSLNLSNGLQIPALVICTCLLGIGRCSFNPQLVGVVGGCCAEQGAIPDVRIWHSAQIRRPPRIRILTGRHG